MDIVWQGNLLKWTNYLRGWKTRYFVLHDGLLEYCKKKGEPLKGKISLSTLEVQKHPKKDNELIINTGVNKIHLKAQNPKEAQDWFVTLKRASTLEHSSSFSYNRESRRHESIDEKAPQPVPLSNKVGELWSVYAMLGESIDSIPQSLRSKCPSLEKSMSLLNTFKLLASEILSSLETQDNKGFACKLPQLNCSMQSADMNEIGSVISPKSIIHEEYKDEEQVEFEDAKSHYSDEQEEYHIPHRKCLPFLRNPNQKYNIWRVVKDSVGKELSKIAVPVYFNEPISFLQRFTEDLTYHEVILNACELTDPVMRLAYVACFSVTSYATTQQRTMKPFNPLLGETFELVRDGYRIISEQVSHHPPVSALHSEHSKFNFRACVDIRTSFKGTHLNVQPHGKYHLELKETGDHFIWTKPQTNVHNIIFGKMYVDHYGKMEISNLATGDKAVLNFHKTGWFEKVSAEVSGTVFDRMGTPHYKVIGRWNSGMAIIDVHTNKKTQVWERYPFPEGYDHNYFFSDFAIQLNLLPEYFPGLPRTDSRFRPDQRALEHGDIKQAGNEKNRLEEKQRAARKHKEETGEIYFPKWFKLVEDDWIYTGGYWESREADSFSSLPDIF